MKHPLATAPRPNCGSVRLVLALLLMAPQAGAQVNVEGLRKELTESGVHAKVNGAITSYRGNTSGTELGAAALLGYRQEKHLGYLSTSANYAHLGGSVQVANAFAHLRYNRTLSDWLAAEVFLQGESDYFRRIRLRTLVGVGPRFRLLDGESVALFYGIAYMYEHDSLSPSVREQPVRPNEVHRLSNYAALLIVLEPERAVFGNTLYYQPRLDDFNDARILDVVSLDFTVSGRLTAGLHASLRYESPVPAPIKRADLTVKNTLGLSF